LRCSRLSFCARRIKGPLFIKQIKKNYGETSNERLTNPDLARLIDQGSFKRLISKIQSEKNCLNDEAFADQNYLPPTLIETTVSSPIMEDEIFGPILPVLTYKNIDEVIGHIRSGSKPLALYIFSKQKKFIEQILRSTSSGGAVVNHVVLHLGNPHLPFGGVGHSGQGSYHGHFGFKSFSHERAILRQSKFSLTKFYFPPYSTMISRFSYKLLRLFE
jgi:aldehyde dehydrogenase (NAD+)